MQKYSGNQKPLVYFFGEKDLDISLYTKRFEIYPYNDIIQAGGIPVPKLDSRILNYDTKLKTGDFIYVSEDFNQVYYAYDYRGEVRNIRVDLEQKLLLELTLHFDFKLMEIKDGIAVYRLTSKSER